MVQFEIRLVDAILAADDIIAFPFFPIMTDQTPNIALFIDYENVQIGRAHV